MLPYGWAIYVGDEYSAVANPAFRIRVTCILLFDPADDHLMIVGIPFDDPDLLVRWNDDREFRRDMVPVSADGGLS